MSVINHDFQAKKHKQPIPSNDGGDTPTIAKWYIDRNSNLTFFLILQIIILIIIGGFFGYVDWSLMVEIFKAKFSDPVTGSMTKDAEQLVNIASFITIAGFFLIGRKWHQKQFIIATGLYLAIVLLLAVSLNAQWGSDIKVLFLKVRIGSGWNPSPNNGDDFYFLLVRWLYLICIAVVFSFGGMAFAYTEHRIEKVYLALIDLRQNLAECRARIKDFLIEQQRLNGMEEDKALVEFLSDTDIVDTFSKNILRAFIESYTTTLAEQKNALSSINFSMSRNDQKETIEKKEQLEQLITQANSLQIP